VGKEGSHTAGNSPGVNDGGGRARLASDDWAQRNGKQALAEIVAQAQVADDFAYLARTPAKAAEVALRKAGLSADGHRPVGDQRGVRLGHAQQHPHARHLRGPGQRQRRRRRARPPRSARRAPGSSVRSCTSCAAAAAGWAARRSAPGGGQGDAVILRVPPSS
jgi:hypothetical protein